MANILQKIVSTNPLLIAGMYDFYDMYQEADTDAEIIELFHYMLDNIDLDVPKERHSVYMLLSYSVDMNISLEVNNLLNLAV